MREVRYVDQAWQPPLLLCFGYEFHLLLPGNVSDVFNGVCC